MNGDEAKQLKDIYASVIRTEEAVKGLKKQEEIHRLHCEDHDKRINKLEICSGRIKGIFATISAAVVVLSGVIALLLAKFLWK